MLIIGLIGQKRVGKDTVADLITEIIGKQNVYRFALANPIKDIARIMFNFSEDQLYNAEKDEFDEEWGIKPRDFFEKFGTDIMQFDIYNYLPGLQSRIPPREFWVQSLIKKIKKIQPIQPMNTQRDTEPIVIITDIRGTHELLAIKKEFSNARFIKITRPSITTLINTDNSMGKHMNNDTDIHLTQLEPQTIPEDLIDFKIVNDKNIDCLRNKVSSILAFY